MNSRSVNKILIKILTELCDFIFAAYNLRFILPQLLYICTPRHDARRIQQRCFIYRSIFPIPALRKRRVHCAAYHFRMINDVQIMQSNIKHTATEQSIQSLLDSAKCQLFNKHYVIQSKHQNTNEIAIFCLLLSSSSIYIYYSNNNLLVSK